jgi:hypothetical protein
MTRNAVLLALLSAVAGCSEPDVDRGSAPTHSAAHAPAIGHVTQASQFADATLLNLVDVGTAAMLTLIADGQPITVQIFYSGDKTTDTGRTPAAPVLVDTISLNSDAAESHQINLNHPAFAGGYGAIFADAVGNDPLTVFQAYLVTLPDGVHSTGGSVFQGGSYRIPVFRNTTKVVLVVTNQSNVSFDIQFASLAFPFVQTINLVPFSTYKFDSSALGWNITTAANVSSLQITADNGGTFAMSGYIQVGATRYRIYPVKVGPYP